MGSFTERCTDSPVPGSSAGAAGSSDQGGGSSGAPFRRSNYRFAPAAADVPGSSKPGPAFMRQATLMGLSSSGTEVGSNPNSPGGLARTPSSGGGCFLGGSSLSRQDSGGLGDLLACAGGGASPYGNTPGGGSHAAGAAAIIGGAFSGSGNSSGVGQVVFNGNGGGPPALGVLHGRSASGTLTAASPLGNSSSAGINNTGGSIGVGSMINSSLMAAAGGSAGSYSSSMGPPLPQLPPQQQQQQQQHGSSGLQITGSAGSGPYSRPSSGSKGCKTVCLLVDAVRSKDDRQLQANLAYCTGGLHGLNDLHPTIDKTPLHEAVSLGYVSMVRMLLAAGSDPNLGPEKQGGPLLQVR
jgi:hypothetical protein